MLESFDKDFKYTKLSDEETTQRGVIGRLVGPIADTKKPTRNGRAYSKELWEKVFNSPIMKEKLENRCLFSELGHPTDRTEIDMEKVCACMAEKPKVGSDGLLYGVFDILPTPNGKILKILCDYGTRIGVSSRGNGDIIQDFDGNEAVDPDTYDCECWDFVVIPAVESVRMSYVTESLQNKKSLQESLNGAIAEANDEDKKVMTETLESLNIPLSANEAEGVNIDAGSESHSADNDGDSVVKDLQQALKENKALEAKVIKLQEQLSVCYAKEAEQEVTAEKLQSTLKSLSEANKSADALKRRNSLLAEKLKTSVLQLKETEKSMQALKESFRESEQESRRTKTSLTETMSKKDEQIHSLQSRVKVLSENIDKVKIESEKELKCLKESIEDTKKDSAIKVSEYEKRISRANSLTEKYKSIAKAAVDKYIDSQAIRLGVRSDEIRNKLPEGYSFEDIDSICENLQEYKINISRLPFDTVKEKKVRISVKESKEPIIPATGLDDDIDESLKGLAGI